MHNITLRSITAILLITGGCSEPSPTGAPSGYVPQDEFNALRDRFEKLQVAYNERPELVELEETKKELASLQESNHHTTEKMEGLSTDLSKQAPSGAYPPASERAANLESQLAGMPRWSLLSDDNGTRTYGHATGIRVIFDEPVPHLPRMRTRYDGTDETERNMGIAVWLLIIGVGGDDDSIYTRNRERIERWNDNPQDLLLLEGGMVHTTVDTAGRVQLDTYFLN